MIAIPNMDKPKSCDECQILRAEFDGSYDKPITGCRQKMGKKNTLQEEYDALILDCPLIELDDELISKFAEAYLEREAEDGNIHT